MIANKNKFLLLFNSILVKYKKKLFFSLKETLISISLCDLRKGFYFNEIIESHAFVNIYTKLIIDVISK